MSTVDLTAASFEETITSNDIVLIDFWASWCGPCRQFAPVYEAAAEKHADIIFGKVDTEAEQQLAAMAQISSIPTLMAFRENILVFSQPGALPAAGLEQVIEGVKGLDMDDVRAQIAKAEANPDEVDLDTFAAGHAAGVPVLDVREDHEWASGHVPGAKHIPMNEVPARIEELDKSKPLFVICQAGGRSRQIVDFLNAQGFQAVNVAGGTGEWIQRGWAIEQ